MSKPAMSKLTMLFIRGCKSSDPRQRLLSIYKRYYSRDVPSNYHAIVAHRLAEIVDEYCPMTCIEMADKSQPKHFFGPDDRCHWDRVRCTLQEHIRYTKRDAFVGLTAPLRFRVTPLTPSPCSGH